MTAPAFIIVGRVRKAHGIRGEVVVEAITDTPDELLASGCRVYAGTPAGDIAPSRQELHIDSVREFNDGLLIAFAEVADRNAAELWRGRYLLVPASEVPPPSEDEVYLHELVGMRVDLQDGSTLGTVEELYELPQGLALDVRRAAPHARETVMILYDEQMVRSVDSAERVIVISPPDGLLE